MSRIAIVGMGAIFPGAGTAADLWRNIRAGVDAITDVPADRWDPAAHYDPDAYAKAPESGRFYCRRGGFVDGLATFDPVRFGLMPAAVDGMEPDQLLALRTAAEAIADAGGDERLPDDRTRIGVVIGRGGYITPAQARFDQRVTGSRQVVSALRDLLPEVDEERLERVRQAFCDRLGTDGPDAVTGIVPSFAASRIANRFDLQGPAYTVDAACASSLLAIDHAVRMLESGQCDAVLAGAVHHAHHATVWGVFSSLRALSPTGEIRPLSRDADGTLLSEGTGVVLLKRLDDAERDGDRVYAVIRGVGLSSDGRSSGLMNPLADGQVLAIERAWREAGLDPATVGLVEAHATGTPVGDAVELETLRRVFGDAGPPIGVGTVKSMIGHAMPASGMAGLVKTAMAVHDGVLPPTLHLEEPHPSLAEGRLRPQCELAEWESSGPRLAAVNAFGFGGANAHLVLEEAPGRSRRVRRKVSAGGVPVLRLAASSVEELSELLAAPDSELLAQAATALDYLDEGDERSCRIAVADPTPRRLELARTVVSRGTAWRGRSDVWFTADPLLGRAGGKVAFLFPGFEPAFEPKVDDVAAQLKLERPELTGRGDLVGHAADVIAVGRTLAAALASLGIRPDVAAGHSLGEWTAMVVAGMYAPDAVDGYLSALDHMTLDIPDVAYAALGCGAERAASVILDVEGVVVSHDNCPHQSVICGPPEQVRQALDRLWAEGVLGQELPFRSGFHTPMAESYLGPVHESFKSLPVQRPEIELWSATTVTPFPSSAEEIRALVVRHLLEPVRFSELVRTLHAEGVRAFVQVGPGSLTGFVGDALGAADFAAMAVNVPKRGGMEQLARVVAALWVEGYVAPAAEVEPEPAGPVVHLALGQPTVRLSGAVPPLTPPHPRQPSPPTQASAPQSATAPQQAAVTQPASAPRQASAPQGASSSQTAAAPGQALASQNTAVPGQASAAQRASAPRQASAQGHLPLPVPGLASAPQHASVPGSVSARRQMAASQEASASGHVPLLAQGAVPLRGAELTHGGGVSEVSLVSPVVAEFEALLDDTAETTRVVLDALRPARTEGETRQVFSLETMPYLLDHCVIPQRAGWQEHSDRFPVVPLTTLLEVMADAAAGLRPGKVVVGLEDVRALRWVVAEPATTATVRASLVAADRVRVVIEGHTEGTVLFADAYPDSPAPDCSPLTAEGPPHVTAERFYAERWMFHGPRYQGVSEISSLAADGVRGVLRSLPTPGALLDSAGQLCGHWIQVHGDRDQTVFPVGIDRVRWYGPLPDEGTDLDLTVWHRTVTCSDAELVLPDGRVWCRIEGWTTHRFFTDEQVWRMKFTPEVSGIGEPQSGGWVLARKRWDTASARDLLMRQYLGATERADFDRLLPRAQDSWLLGRIAAKDAVRYWLWDQGSGPIFPAELNVQDDDHGKVRVTLRDGDGGGRLTVSIACTAELGVAVVEGASAGVDFEVVGADRLLVSAGGAVVTVVSRDVDGHVVTSMEGD